jgi:exodeoxyribonuclease VII large subunit
MPKNQALTVSQYSQRLSDAIASSPGVRNVWVVGETSDLRLSGGHCYLELLEKDNNGRTLARIRANIWASQFSKINAEFYKATGAQLASGMKIMACVSASYHVAYGMSVNIVQINAEYTLGDAVRLRNEIIRRLTAEGVLELNRKLQWAQPALRIAVVSAKGAAGYGDFINQLYNNAPRLRFTTKLFPAVMQGDKTVASVMAALDAIDAERGCWDGVVIIRGGGSTSDLAAFDNYDLAVRIAKYELPVIVGIGHERDITVLDYVANMRVKTPTAAAEWLIARGKAVLDALDNAANLIYQCVSQRIAGNREQLARLSAAIPGMTTTALTRNGARLDRAGLMLTTLGPRFIQPRLARLDVLRENLGQATAVAITAAKQRVKSAEQLIAALSPESTLKRGYSLTYDVNGKIITSTSQAKPGDYVHTFLADGSITSQVNRINK